MASVRTTILVLLFYWLNSGEFGGGVMAQASPQTSQTSVTVTAPLNPVKQGDILSVHCKVERHSTSNTVQIARQRDSESDKKSLTTDNIITEEKENRMFIAKRLLKDSSTVFFLSITDVTRDDEAEYSCNVIQGISNIIAEEKVKIKIQYFPEEGPTCESSPAMPIKVLERELVILNCTSPIGNPAVDVTWIKTGGDQTPFQTKGVSSDTAYSTLELHPTLADNDNSIYQCEVRSNVFRGNDYVHRCHIGPFEVVYNPTTPPPTRITTTPSPVLTTPYRPPITPVLPEECKEFCRLEQEPTIFYWTIATVIAGILAIVFLIMGIIILIKYCMALHSARAERGRGSRGRPSLVPPGEEVDAGVEFRRDDNRVYMSLDRSGRVQAEPLYQARGELVGAHYILTPTRGDDGQQQYIVTPTRDRPSTSQTEAVYQGGVVLERPVIGTPIRGELERQYIAGYPGMSGERQQYIATQVRGEGDRPQYIATPIRGSELGAIGPQYSATPGTPHGTPHGTPKRGEGESERPQYIATPALSEGERQYIVTPSQGGGMERHYLDTPTLPPRRYRSQYV